MRTYEVETKQVISRWYAIQADTATAARHKLRGMLASDDPIPQPITEDGGYEEVVMR